MREVVPRRPAEEIVSVLREVQWKVVSPSSLRAITVSVIQFSNCIFIGSRMSHKEG